MRQTPGLPGTSFRVAIYRRCPKSPKRFRAPASGSGTSSVCACRTLRCWFDRVYASADVAAALKDDRFVRMWRHHLAASEQTCRHGPQDVFQVQLCRKPDAVPITRDCLYPPPVQRLAQAAE